MCNENLIDKITEGDKSSIGELYQNNAGLIYKICRRFVSMRYDIDDLMQQAYFPFLRAIKSYKANPEHKFTTYLTKGLEWYFIRYIGHDKGKKDMCILDSPISRNQLDGDCLIDTISDESAINEDGIVDDVAYSQVMGIVRKSLDNYCTDKPETDSGKLYNVIHKRFIDDYTLNRLADEYNMSIERARQIETKALRILRHPKNKELLEYREHIISRTYRMGSFGQFKNTRTSGVEWAVMRLLDK